MVHGFGNPSNHKDAHIVFDLPHTHTTAEDKLLADQDEVTVIAEAIPDGEYELVAEEQPLVIVRRKLGQLAHEHTTPEPPMH